MLKRSLAFLTIFAASTACTQQGIFLIAPQTLDAIGTITKDTATCIGVYNTCRPITNHDGYEESQLKAMSNSELATHAAKQKKKTAF